MDAIKKRFPARGDVLLVFGLAFVLIYSWSTLMFFNYLPGWILFLSGWTITGLFAYSQIFAFFESLLLLAFLVLLAVFLPRRFFRDWFVPQGSAIVLLAAAAAVFLHFKKEVPLWPSKQLIFGVLLYLGLVAVSSLLIRRSPLVKETIERVVARLQILLYVYMPVVLLSLVIVVLRNIF